MRPYVHRKCDSHEQDHCSENNECPRYQASRLQDSTFQRAASHTAHTNQKTMSDQNSFSPVLVRYLADVNSKVEPDKNSCNFETPGFRYLNASTSASITGQVAVRKTMIALSAFIFLSAGTNGVHHLLPCFPNASIIVRCCSVRAQVVGLEDLQ